MTKRSLFFLLELRIRSALGPSQLGIGEDILMCCEELEWVSASESSGLLMEGEKQMT